MSSSASVKLRYEKCLEIWGNANQAIANVVKYRATHGYLRVLARLRLDGHDGVNHKRVCQVMRDEG